MLYDPFVLTVLIFVTVVVGTMNLCWYVLCGVRFTVKTIPFAFIPVLNIPILIGLMWLERAENAPDRA
jgi:hypothetical protein